VNRKHWYNLRHMARIWEQDDDPYYKNLTPDIAKVRETVGVHHYQPRYTLLEAWKEQQRRTDQYKPSREQLRRIMRNLMQSNWRRP
jgi:hypothetical protein